MVKRWEGEPCNVTTFAQLHTQMGWTMDSNGNNQQNCDIIGTRWKSGDSDVRIVNARRLHSEKPWNRRHYSHTTRRGKQGEWTWFPLCYISCARSNSTQTAVLHAGLEQGCEDKKTKQKKTQKTNCTLLFFNVRKQTEICKYYVCRLVRVIGPIFYFLCDNRCKFRRPTWFSCLKFDYLIDVKVKKFSKGDG